jgi:hypothetical protein
MLSRLGIVNLHIPASTRIRLSACKLGEWKAPSYRAEDEGKLKQWSPGYR